MKDDKTYEKGEKTEGQTWNIEKMVILIDFVIRVLNILTIYYIYKILPNNFPFIGTLLYIYV